MKKLVAHWVRAVQQTSSHPATLYPAQAHRPRPGLPGRHVTPGSCRLIGGGLLRRAPTGGNRLPSGARTECCGPASPSRGAWTCRRQWWYPGCTERLPAPPPCLLCRPLTRTGKTFPRPPLAAGLSLLWPAPPPQCRSRPVPCCCCCCCRCGRFITICNSNVFIAQVCTHPPAGDYQPEEAKKDKNKRFPPSTAASNN